MSSLETVETPRLVLQRVRMAHRPFMYQMDADARIVGEDGVRSQAEVDRFIISQTVHWDCHGFGVWMAFDRARSTCVGRGGLRHISLEGESVVQVGYGFFPWAWGQGYATELAATAADLGFHTLGLARIVAVTLPGNAASRKVLEKTGFRYVRETLYEGRTHALYERFNAPRS